MRDVKGRLRQVYLGSANDERARALRDALVARKDPPLADLERITAAYVASGGARHQGAHFAVIDTLARAGIFRAGAVLVGSHAFVSIGAALGTSSDAATIATADVDLSGCAATPNGPISRGLVSRGCRAVVSRSVRDDSDVPGTFKSNAGTMKNEGATASRTPGR
ncbi:MAG TPA: GSU2403 family nucleotidyltransferase fold protein [Polyangiaceae bacterium]|jgi:hypothetical protein